MESSDQDPEVREGPPSRQVTVRPTARLLAGRYHLADRIGAGGYGEVYAAFDEQTERTVAVKIHPRCDSAQARADFLKEAQRTATVAHPSVVRVYDAGFDGAEPYLVMELIEGQTVATRIAARGAMASRSALTIANRMLRGLIHIHEQDLLHGDLKPSNVFLTHDRQVKLIDFGISRRCAEPSDEHDVRGTPPYVPPEVILGEHADERSDVYGVGLVLYAMLAGRSAYQQRVNVVQTFHEVLAGQAPSLDALRPSLREALVAFVAKAMAREPVDRFRDASAMRHALGPLLASARENPSVHPPSVEQPIEGSISGAVRFDTE
jgi:serine/threonine protein kinase